jgi:predicted dehydrogenase
VTSVRVGVAGAGSLGFHHVRLFRELTGGAFGGVFERNEARAAHVSKELGVICHASLDALFAQCDAVSVAVPTAHHFAVAKAALEAGKHVFVEKPITVTVAEADELIALAAARGLVLQVGHGERYNRAVRAARPHINRPWYLETERGAPFTPRGADVSVVLDLMIHDIDLASALIGSPVTSVAAIGGMLFRPTADLAQARLGFESGAVANLHASRVAETRRRRMRIYQADGYLSLDLATGAVVHQRLRSGVDFAQLGAAPQVIDAYAERVVLEAPEGETLRFEFEAFLAAIRGEAPVPVTGEAARDALAVAIAVDEAIAMGAEQRRVAGRPDARRA